MSIYILSNIGILSLHIIVPIFLELFSFMLSILSIFVVAIYIFDSSKNTIPLKNFDTAVAYIKNKSSDSSYNPIVLNKSSEWYLSI